MRLSLLLVLLTAVLAQAQQAPRVLLVGGPSALWPQIVEEYSRRYPSQPAVWHTDAEGARGPADLVFAYYPTAEQIKGSASQPAKHRLGFPVEFVASAWKAEIDQDASARASAYLDEGGVENGVRLLAYLYSLAHGGAAPPEPPIKRPQVGIYHPDAPDLFFSYDAYRNWWHARTPSRDATDRNPRVIAVTFFSTWLRGHDLETVDTLVRRLEQRGLMPVAAFGYPLNAVTPLLQSQGVVQPESVIALTATLSAPGDAEVYRSWGIPIVNGIVTRESAEQWQENAKGLPADRIAAHLSLPERAGLIGATLVATTETNANGTRSTRPFEPGIESVLDRVAQTIALRHTSNAEKRVALIYYNNPSGKGNIGASYLQVFPTLRNVLAALAGDGYRVEQPLPDAARLRTLLEANGRNVELWAQGELQRMASLSAPSSGMVRWPVAEYRRYYDQLPGDFRAAVERTWGPPEKSRLMTADCAEARCLLLPAQQTGNILMAPQPLRTSFEQASNPNHEIVTPPPHQYIAFYLWLQHEWNADALVHVGRHGTLEWLPGKHTALAPEDAPMLLLGDLPNFNIYVMDGGGEAIVAKRRGLATLVSHLTPMIWRAGGRADLEPLHQSFHVLMERADELSPALRAEYEKTTRAELSRLGLDRQLNIARDADWKVLAPTLHRFLHDIEDAPVPAGLPVFGQAPLDDQLYDAVSAYLFAAFPRPMHDEVKPFIPEWAAAFVIDEAVDLDGVRPEVADIVDRVSTDLPAWIQSLRDSGAAEIQGLLTALKGQHLPSHLLGDPLRKPEALPTGANLHAVDTARIPTEAAWNVGRKMADEFLQRYREDNGSPPKRVSVVLWYGETERHQGAMESMAMALLGVRPVWNQQGIVDDLQLIDRATLGRDRVDVVFTVSGTYRDGFPDKLQLLDRAVRLASTAGDGIVAGHDRELEAAMIRAGVSTDDARRQSQVRVFSAKPGAYGVGVQYLVEKSGGGDSPDAIAAMYMANMAFGYSSSDWGNVSSAALRANLASVDAVQFSRSSNLYASLDNDDTYQYVGGLRTAIQHVAHRAPGVYLHNLRQAGSQTLASLREWLAVELHSRQFNPTWIEEMRKSGYAGAREISREIEHLYGFQATASEHLDSRTWQTVLDVFVKDTHQLGLREFFGTQNPHARQIVLARLLEVDRQRIHTFSTQDQRMLLVEYARSLAADGAACNAQVCGNTVLRQHVGRELRKNGDRAVAGEMDAALRTMLERRLPARPFDTEHRLQHDVEWQMMGARTSWITPWAGMWQVQPLPWWVWVAASLIYLTVVLVFARHRQRSARVALTSLSSADRGI